MINIQMVSVIGVKAKTSDILIPEILGEQPVVEVSLFSGQATIVNIGTFSEPKTAEEIVNVISEGIEEKEGERPIWIDLIEQTNPENNLICFSNSFKRYKIELNGESLEGSLGDIIRAVCFHADKDPYYIAEEEDGTIISIARKD